MFQCRSSADPCLFCFWSNADMKLHVESHHNDYMSARGSQVFQEEGLNPFPPFQDVLNKIIHKIENMEKQIQSLVRI